ncbi:polyamine ABC transporter ATP-binding protein [Pokkaliibacter plantistimulans]|uniref:Polyamine ABC transporter ATP-binding protein n=1 Tax=Proteobacteria bacterium 228 TaxID=2083153 RepID=A0A2S5KYM0_9PROT|nr:ABC transporter ATP-binding protein [Pokkaliibacter plantistimulans]PPC79366.1 polyamine ABC transporter ATP-binding protein [Pokkaliibacter plantistimulans]
MSGLVLNQVTKRYGSMSAVADVNLQLPEGKMVCFLGPSGCGKTTLLRMIAGLESVSAGQIVLDGQDVCNVPAYQRNFGMVFQSLALFPHMTVGQNIAYPLRLRKVSKDQQQQRVSELLKLIQLEEMRDRPVARLSGGQRQRVAIARAIASHPKLLLLDEPLSALDAKLRESMQVEIRQLQQKLNITTIMVTHDQREAMTMADLVVVLGEQRVQQVGSPLEIYRRPANAFVADFIGSGNLFPATLREPGLAELPDGSVIAVMKDERADQRPASGDARGKGDAVQLLVRPEDIRLEAVAGSHALQGIVTFVRDVGATIETSVACAGINLTALSLPGHGLCCNVGDVVSVTLPPEACRVLY